MVHCLTIHITLYSHCLYSDSPMIPTALRWFHRLNQETYLSSADTMQNVHTIGQPLPDVT